MFLIIFSVVLPTFTHASEMMWGFTLTTILGYSLHFYGGESLAFVKSEKSE